MINRVFFPTAPALTTVLCVDRELEYSTGKLIQSQPFNSRAEKPSSPYAYSLFSARIGVRLAVDVGGFIFGIAVGNPNAFPVLFVG